MLTMHKVSISMNNPAIFPLRTIVFFCINMERLFIQKVK